MKIAEAERQINQSLDFDINPFRKRRGMPLWSIQRNGRRFYILNGKNLLFDIPFTPTDLVKFMRGAYWVMQAE